MTKKRIKKLYRLKENRILGGVCTGLGKYFEIDPVLLRLLWIIGTLIFGAGVLAYLIAWIIIPEEK
jgi:phage shock protein C